MRKGTSDPESRRERGALCGMFFVFENSHVTDVGLLAGFPCLVTKVAFAVRGLPKI